MIKGFKRKRRYLCYLNQDKYISNKEYEKYCKENEYDVNYMELEKRNNDYVERKLKKEDKYLENLFKTSYEKIFLDEEQRRIIIRDDDYCLINAGAGSGKSTTMAAKVKYLVEKQKVNPKEIIMLSYTKKSSEDLDEKVNQILKLGIPVSTFHSLGMRFIRKMYEVPVTIADYEEKEKIITKYLASLFKDKEKLTELIELFKLNNRIKHGFIDNYQKFETFEDYFEDYKKRIYKRESKNENGIHIYIENKLNSKTNLYTIKGEKCKSLGEVRIANFLYINGIDYKYERVFDERVGEDRAYVPDFTIEHLGEKIYIEYFGLSSFYENNELTKKAKQRYDYIRRKKEKFQANNNYDFINLDYKTPDGYFLDTLEKELLKRNIKLMSRPDDEIFYKILDNNPRAEFFTFVDEIIQFINILKNMLEDDIDELFERKCNEILNEKFTRCYYSNIQEVEAQKRIKAIKILKDIYYFYEEELTKRNMVDYEDMINKCYQHIIKEVKNKYNDMQYKYIVVDEYQDITFQRFLFVKRLVEYFDAKLVAVGDDWQSIYSFTGSRLELFNRFNEFFHGAKDDMILSTTYRYGQELADIAGEFVLANNEQSLKEIKSIKHLEEPIEIIEYPTNCEAKVIYELIHKIYEENPKHKILLLARTNANLDVVKKERQYFKEGINDIIICSDIPDANIEAITIHKSKGLTADQVIVFGLRERTFPSKGESDFWIFNYFKLDSFYNTLKVDDEDFEFSQESYPYAEERRLFYVAITRTRNKVYLVVPKDSKKVSSFVDEIKDYI